MARAFVLGLALFLVGCGIKGDPAPVSEDGIGIDRVLEP